MQYSLDAYNNSKVISDPSRFFNQNENCDKRGAASAGNQTKRCGKKLVPAYD